MSNFLPSYNGLKIDPFTDDKSALLKEARRLSGFIKRRYKKLNKYDLRTHEMEKLEFERTRVLGDKNYSPFYVSKNFTTKQLQRVVKQYDKYLSSDYSTLEGLVEQGQKLLNEGETAGKKDLARLANYAIAVKDSVNEIAEFYDSDFIKNFYSYVNEDNKADMYNSLHKLYQKVKDEKDLPTIEDLEGIVGDKLR